ncbi:glucose 1-dehydrogenase [Roseococcus sp. SDR]|uniref:SDR family NAD(P)-dependent oxidoreductase n=1 Tax=Roseococcus sp. SDR TaxID=2835532 RepID=UPI001BCC6603|nr:glucose 1-dehydrogenase [Roseococcus sp. SDR]MBS7790663.1 glucose 1-dehydrogenase [Roseococcus sp. SDR]MBV1845977.1 glucose 1-dehydrogenase [Roseococcus sp. SDR]
MFDLTGRVALVTGGNGGIGLGFARGLAKAGASVVLAGRDAAKSAAALEELRALGAKAEAVSVDVTDPDSIKAMVAAAAGFFGRLDILVNNAGTNIRSRPEETSLADWHTVLNTNLTSTMFAAQAAYPHLKAGGVGRIINNGSMLSIFGMPLHAAYSSSKGAVVQLTKTLATAWAKDGITVNCVLPGWIDTALTRGARRDMPTLDENVRTRAPAGRWGTPEDFEGIAAFYASDAAAYITGTSIAVDGGYSIQG